MIGLTYLNSHLKDLIVRIIDSYQLDLHYMENGIESITYGPGIYFCNVFSDDYNIITIEADNKRVVIHIESSKLECGDDYNKTERDIFAANNGALIHAKFIESACFIKWLAENNLIYLTKENNNIQDIPTKSDYTPNFRDVRWRIGSESLSNFILSHYNSRILPSQYLISFTKNGFRTDEQIRYESQLKISQKSLEESHTANIVAKQSLRVARRANRIAIAVAIITIIVSIVCR